jgi:hypothetical protein
MDNSTEIKGVFGFGHPKPETGFPKVADTFRRPEAGLFNFKVPVPCDQSVSIRTGLGNEKVETGTLGPDPCGAEKGYENHA